MAAGASTRRRSSAGTDVKQRRGRSFGRAADGLSDDAEVPSPSPSPAPRGRHAAAEEKAKPTRSHNGEPAKKPELLAEQPWRAKMRSFRVRTLSTFAMVSGFVFILYLGHVVTCCLVFSVQARTPRHSGRSYG